MDQVQDNSKAVPVKKRAVFIDPGRMYLAEYQRQDWVANAPEGVTPEDLKDPAFWSLMAASMKPFDRIDVRADDGSWLAEVLVKQADRTYAVVSVLNVYQLDENTPPAPADDFDVLWRGPQNKWCVKRLTDDEIVKAGLSTRAEGNAWLTEYRKAL